MLKNQTKGSQLLHLISSNEVTYQAPRLLLTQKEKLPAKRSDEQLTEELAFRNYLRLCDP